MKNFIEIMKIIALIQGFFLGTVLLFRKKNHFSNILFSLLLFSISLSIATWIFYTNGFEKLFYIMMFFQQPGFFMYGPLIYLYTLSLVGNKKSLQALDRIHFIPVIFYLSYLLIRFHIIGGTVNFTEVDLIDKSSRITNLHVNILGIFSIGVYIIASVRGVRKYNIKKKDCYSSIYSETPVWLGTLFTIAIAFVLNLLIISVIMLKGFNQDILNFFNIILCSLFIISVFAATFFTIRFPVLFLPVPDVKKARYEKNFIDEDTIDIYRNRILSFMDEAMPYLDDSFTLKKLSDQLNIPGHHLSMTLNLSLKQNFYIFINSYRINEVKRRLLDPKWDDHTILTIAFQTGFNSKSTFNTMFKKFTGMTPTRFRKTRHG